MNAPQKSVLSLKRAAPAENTPQIEERLHKVLANAGLGSRRMLEQRIQAGEVEVNGSAATIGASVRAGDRVVIDGKQTVASQTFADRLVPWKVLFGKPLVDDPGLRSGTRRRARRRRGRGLG